MTTIRNPAVAGMFYPAEAGELSATVNALLADTTRDCEPPKAMIVPHAGYVYSGPVAANAYTSLAAAHDRISTVVLLGPSHRVYFKGIAAPSADMFATPLGNIPIDQHRIDALQVACPYVSRYPDAHAQEHSLEVHLPFLQTQLDEFKLIPLVVGDATPEQVERVIDQLWGGSSTLIVISSDLSHYHDYATARQLDGETADAIEALAPERLSGDRACGFLPVSGMLRSARRRGIQAERVDLRNSGDIAGSRDRVVGYGAWVFHEASASLPGLSDSERASLTELALASIRHGLAQGEPLHYQAGEDTSAALRERGACFVTLNKAGQLRGCIGSLSAHRPLAEDVCENAYSAAFRDPRFSALTQQELDDIELSISVLTPAREMEFDSEQDLVAQLRPGVDGLILTDLGRRGTFLPSVWEHYPEATDFLRHLKLKAGLPVDYWSNTLRVERYTTISW